MKTPEELIRASRLRLPVSSDRLIAALLPRVGLSSYPWVPEAMPRGVSRFGGPADLPSAVEWPQVEGRPLLLLSQLNFAQLRFRREHPHLQSLPERGWLCLFLDIDGTACGHASAAPGVVAMQFAGDADQLIRHDPQPAANAEVWTQCHAVAVYPADHHRCLPASDAVDSPLPAAQQEAFRDAYNELASAIDDLARSRHEVTLLGSPTLYNPDPRSSLEDPNDWMLLLEFKGDCSWLAGTTDPSTAYLDQPKLGSADFVQYFVRKSDYANGRLDRGYLDYMLT